MMPMEIMTTIAITGAVLAAISAGTCGGLLAYISTLRKENKN
jgi:hypothetical protein